jgi:hypothetical protein
MKYYRTSIGKADHELKAGVERLFELSAQAGTLRVIPLTALATSRLANGIEPHASLTRHGHG